MTATDTSALPILKYPGSKLRLVHWIGQHLPPHMPLYAEPFAGTAAVYIAHHHRIANAALNDANEALVTFFRTLQDPDTAKQLVRRLSLTPYSRKEQQRASSILKDPSQHDSLTVAWAVFTAHNQGFGGRPHQGWGTATTYNIADTFHDKVRRLRLVAQALLKAQLDCTDALTFIKRWDTPDTTLYVDPPYPQETQRDTHTHYYSHTTDHQALIDTLAHTKGTVLLSYYDHPALDTLTKAGFAKHTRTVQQALSNNTYTPGTQPKATEVLMVRHARPQPQYHLLNPPPPTP